MKLDVQLLADTAAPTTLACDGNVVFQEVAPPGAQEQPMAIRGSHLTVDRMDTAPYITLRGAAAAGDQHAGGDAAFAQITGRGVTMFVNVLEADVRENRMWSDGPGRATLMITRDLQGQAAATAFPLDLSWRGKLNFDGSTIAFEQDVVAAGADDKLQCDRLGARLNSQIVFGEAIDQRAIDVMQVDCEGRVTMNHLSRDAGGVTSHERMQLSRLSINQQTGAISGMGPGVIRSTRFGDGLAAIAGLQNPAAPKLNAPPPGAAGSKLSFVRVDFQKNLTGNLILREVQFHEKVRTVYGPVDAWEQELDLAKPETLPPEAMTMLCDTMRINEAPSTAQASTGPDKLPSKVNLQFRATGNVQINGQVPNQGPFTARADVASYEGAKDAFVLEGSVRTPATLWRPRQAGAPPAARLIRYVPSRNEISVEGIQFLQITPQDVENARRPGTVK
jgi:hypothetical protein